MRNAIFALAAATLAASSAAGGERALLYPAVVGTGVNMVGDGKWTYPSGDSVRFKAERLSGGPFSEADPAWQLEMCAPEGAYWRHQVKVKKGRRYLMGAWVRMDNTKVAIRGHGRAISGGHNEDKRVYLYGGFNAYLKPYMSERMMQLLAGDPNEWKLLYRLVEYPDGVAGDRLNMAVGIYLSTGRMAFANPFFIDVTDMKDRALAVDVSSSRPFRRIAVIATDIGDEVWHVDFE